MYPSLSPLATSEEWELEDITTESHFSESEEGENAHHAHKEGHKVTRLDVQHDRALIKWTSGHANGSPIIAYQVFMARIREFRYEDVQLQAAIRRDAAATNKDNTSVTSTTMVGGGDIANNTMLNSSSSSSSSSLGRPPPRVGSQSLLTAVMEDEINEKEVVSVPSLTTGATVSVLHPGGSSSTTSASGHASTSLVTGASVSVLHPAGSSSSTALHLHLEDTRLNEAQLDWRDVTSMGEPMGPQAFRATGLSPGTSYVFCVRQRNEKGWSAFSRPRYQDIRLSLFLYDITPL